VSIEMLPTDLPCDECQREEGVMVLAVVRASVLVEGIALCQRCRIMSEAMLRGARKGGERISKW